MSPLDVVEDALHALAVCLQAHGPACVCAPCTASSQATAFLPRLAHLLAVLTSWSTAEWADDQEDQVMTQEELREALRVLAAAEPPAAGEGEA